MFSGEATNTNFTVYILTRPGIKFTIYSTRGKYTDHYTTKGWNVPFPFLERVLDCHLLTSYIVSKNTIFLFKFSHRFIITTIKKTLTSVLSKYYPHWMLAFNWFWTFWFPRIPCSDGCRQFLFCYSFLWYYLLENVCHNLLQCKLIVMRRFQYFTLSCRSLISNVVVLLIWRNPYVR